MTILILAAMFMISSCTDGGDKLSNSPQENNFQNDQELETYLKDQFAKSVLPQDVYSSKTVINEEGSETSDGVSTSADDAMTQGYTGTNIQEQGVDESDMVKTDGTYMYIAGDNKVTVVDVSSPGNMQVKSTIKIDGYINSLYLYNGILTVLYVDHIWGGVLFSDVKMEDSANIGMPYWIPVKAKTNACFYNVKDSLAPVLIKDVVVDGNFVSSRMIGAKLHLIQQFLPQLPALDYSYDGTEEGWNGAVEKNKEQINALSLDEMLPSYAVCNENGESVESGRLIETENFYKLNDAGGASMATVTTFDLDHLSDPFVSVGIIANAETVYASTKALYITAVNWDYDETYADNIVSATNTNIHKFDLAGEKVIHVASGSVKGQILNQFSLGEYEDVLRIATTDYKWSIRSDTNGISSNVFCLKNVDGKLTTIGKIENIAPGENMYSARFMEKYGYLVTFVQIDPLFTLDLADPYNPKIIGELKVPGYSSYIHPYSDNHLLTIGVDVKEEQGVYLPQGLQLSLFDISDFANPKLLHKTLIGDPGTYSEALYNHKAFTFWAENNLLAIPVNLYEKQSNEDDYGSNTFNGLYVYHVTQDKGFELLGRIETFEKDFYYWVWMRGIFIDKIVFAVQPNVIFSAEIEDIANSIKKLIIEEIQAQGPVASERETNQKSSFASVKGHEL